MKILEDNQKIEKKENQEGERPLPLKDVCAQRENSVEQSSVEKSSRYFFRERKPKRRRSDDNDDVQERDAKIIRSMVAWITEDQQIEEIAFTSVEVPASQLRVYGKCLTDIIEKAFLVAITDRQDFCEYAHACSGKGKKVVNGINIPRTYKEAVSDSCYSEKWKQAIQEEIKSLVKNGT